MFELFFAQVLFAVFERHALGIDLFAVIDPGFAGSSGISQLIDSDGQVVARGNFPGQGEMIGGVLELPRRGRLPVDYWVAPLAVFGAVFFMAAIFLKRFRGSLFRKRGPRQEGSALDGFLANWHKFCREMAVPTVA